MVEVLEQKPFHERPSQQVGFVDYLKGSLAWGALPFIAGAVAVAVGKATKYKMFPLDGSPALIQKGYEKLFGFVAKDTVGVELAVNPDRFGFHSFLGMEAGRAAVLTKDTWNFLKTVEIAVIPTIFHFWRHSERQRISLTPLHQRLQAVADLKPSDAELREENASLRAQLAYVNHSAPHAAQPGTLIADRQHDGRAETTAHQSQAI